MHNSLTKPMDTTKSVYIEQITVTNTKPLKLEQK